MRLLGGLPNNGSMVKLANTLDLRSGAARLVGSTPTTPTITRELLEKHKDESQYGYSCMYIPLDKNFGVKMFRTRDERDAARKYQKLGHKHGIGPAVYQNVRVYHGITSKYTVRKIYKWGYVTQVAAICSAIDENSHEYIELVEKIRELDLSAGDLHSSNVGRINRKLVCIDFDNMSMNCVDET